MTESDRTSGMWRLPEDGIRLLVRVIGAPDQRSRLHVRESELQADLFEVGEFGRRVIPGHRHVRQRWPQVLSDGDDPATCAPKIPERLYNLVPLLAEPDHQAGLCRHSGGVGARALEQLERARVTATR